ncbi:hypothetical protein, partial [Desulfovibrio sp. 1214_IL3152]|uniref:hypothetical protein n=1 Tax=Desulfovibrio sp. 1214_IL3152 TaxID=3084056 RepID=UPI002FD8D1E1
GCDVLPGTNAARRDPRQVRGWMCRVYGAGTAQHTRHGDGGQFAREASCGTKKPALPREGRTGFVHEGW